MSITLTLLAIPFGSGLYTFMYADGLSYLSKDPAACANCHVMRETFDDWQRGSHAHAATCVDCHLPRSFVGKWFTKAENGFSHSIAMTLGHFDNIRARPVSRAIARENCLHCHGDTVAHFSSADTAAGQGPDCVFCHRSIGHSH